MKSFEVSNDDSVENNQDESREALEEQMAEIRGTIQGNIGRPEQMDHFIRHTYQDKSYDKHPLEISEEERKKEEDYLTGSLMGLVKNPRFGDSSEVIESIRDMLQGADGDEEKVGLIQGLANDPGRGLEGNEGHRAEIEEKMKEMEIGKWVLKPEFNKSDLGFMRGRLLRDALWKTDVMNDLTPDSLKDAGRFDKITHAGVCNHPLIEKLGKLMDTDPSYFESYVKSAGLNVATEEDPNTKKKTHSVWYNPGAYNNSIIK